MWASTPRSVAFFFVFSQSLVFRFVQSNFEDYYWGSFCRAHVQHGKSLFIFLKAFLSVSLKHLYFDWWHPYLPTAKCRSVPSQWSLPTALFSTPNHLLPCARPDLTTYGHMLLQKGVEDLQQVIPLVSILLYQSGEERGQSQPWPGMWRLISVEEVSLATQCSSCPLSSQVSMQIHVGLMCISLLRQALIWILLLMNKK